MRSPMRWATGGGTPRCRSPHARIWWPSLSRKNRLRRASERNTASEERLFSAPPMPCSSCGTAVPIAVDASCLALSAALSLTPASPAQPASVSLASARWAASASRWLPMPARITTTTTPASTIAPRTSSPVPATRPMPRRSSHETTGDATAAMTAAVMRGMTIVCVSDSSATRPTTNTPTPTNSQADMPRSRSHRGAANKPVRSRGSNASSSCGGGWRSGPGRSRRVRNRGMALGSGQRAPLELLELGLVDRAGVQQLLGAGDLGRRAVGRGHVADVVVEHLLLLAHARLAPLGHVVAVGDQVHEDAQERQEDGEDHPSSLAPPGHVAAAEDVAEDDDEGPEPHDPEEEHQHGPEDVHEGVVGGENHGVSVAARANLGNGARTESRGVSAPHGSGGGPATAGRRADVGAGTHRGGGRASSTAHAPPQSIRPPVPETEDQQWRPWTRPSVAWRR